MSESWVLDAVAKEAERRAFERFTRDPDGMGVCLFGVPYSKVIKMLRYVENQIGKSMYEITDEDLGMKADA